MADVAIIVKRNARFDSILESRGMVKRNSAAAGGTDSLVVQLGMRRVKVHPDGVNPETGQFEPVICKHRCEHRDFVAMLNEALLQYEVLTIEQMIRKQSGVSPTGERAERDKPTRNEIMDEVETVLYGWCVKYGVNHPEPDNRKGEEPETLTAFDGTRTWSKAVKQMALLKHFGYADVTSEK